VADSHEEGDCWVCVEMEVVGRAGGCDQPLMALVGGW
jgi:hypothetical protein